MVTMSLRVTSGGEQVTEKEHDPIWRYRVNLAHAEAWLSAHQTAKSPASKIKFHRDNVQRCRSELQAAERGHL